MVSILDSMFILYNIKSNQTDMEFEVPFKEKIAWIALTSTVVIWGCYFGFMGFTRSQLPGRVYFLGFFGAVVVQAFVVVGAAIVTALLAPKDASAARDERDRAIGRRAAAFAYPVLITLVLCVAAGLHMGLSARGMAYGIMGAIVLAEIVHYGAQIVGYRAGR